MTNLVVASFANEAQAIEASHKLTELESFGDITVYEKVIVKKDKEGNITPIQADTSEGLRTLSGMTLGAIVGAFAGPVGLMVGMLSGTLVGSTLEADYVDFSEDFGSKVTKQLQPGMVAIIAEIYEEGPAFVDNALEPLGAAIFRSDVDYVYDDYVDNQINQIDEEIAEERARIKSASQAEKSKIQEGIVRLKEKRHKRISELKQRQKDTIAKIKGPIWEARKSHLVKRINNHKEKIAELESKLKKMDSEKNIHSTT
jgi:uncharacterized membrane protein